MQINAFENVLSTVGYDTLSARHVGPEALLQAPP
jgi:hypothetical protein